MLVQRWFTVLVDDLMQIEGDIVNYLSQMLIDILGHAGVFEYLLPYLFIEILHALLYSSPLFIFLLQHHGQLLVLLYFLNK